MLFFLCLYLHWQTFQPIFFYKRRHNLFNHFLFADFCSPSFYFKQKQGLFFSTDRSNAKGNLILEKRSSYFKKNSINIKVFMVLKNVFRSIGICKQVHSCKVPKSMMENILSSDGTG